MNIWSPSCMLVILLLLSDRDDGRDGICVTFQKIRVFRRAYCTKFFIEQLTLAAEIFIFYA